MMNLYVVSIRYECEGKKFHDRTCFNSREEIESCVSKNAHWVRFETVKVIRKFENLTVTEYWELSEKYQSAK